MMRSSFRGSSTVEDYIRSTDGQVEKHLFESMYPTEKSTMPISFT